MKLSNLTNVINKQNIGAVMSRLGSAVLNPNTLTGIAVVGVPVTIGLTVAATRKAMKEVGDSENEDFFDKARRVWKYYVPVVASGTMCIVCIVASNRVSAKERAALASALAVSEEALKQYQSKLESETGTKTRVVAKEVSENTILDVDEDMNPRLDALPKDERVWCRDKVTGNMFKTSKARIDMVNGMIYKTYKDNEKLTKSDLAFSNDDLQMYTINDMYNALGVAGIEIGDDYFIRVDDEQPLIVNSDVTLNGEFMLTMDYYTTKDYGDI